MNLPNFYSKKCPTTLPAKLRDPWRPPSSVLLEPGMAGQVSISWLCLQQGTKQGRAPGWPAHRQLCLPCAGWSQWIPSPAVAGHGLGQCVLQGGCSAVPMLFWGGRGIEEGNQPSRSAAWPQAGERLPAGPADWQGCSHQRPHTTYLKLSLLWKASFLLGEVGLC